MHLGNPPTYPFHTRSISCLGADWWTGYHLLIIRLIRLRVWNLPKWFGEKLGVLGLAADNRAVL